MCWPSYKEFRSELVSWRFIPGEINSPSSHSKNSIKYIQFPIEDRLELTFGQDGYLGGYTLHTFNVLNFVWRGGAKKFNIERFMRMYHRIYNSTPPGPCPIKYSKQSVFKLIQIESLYESFSLIRGNLC